ncbi:2-oxo-4-hydroxy-4-carboxy-5-ureidoimidazoline decarboxylase [Nonomuraea sp. NPDC049419]|uniref:2-oxo-4-hydroxy-4-carboxy-5-ureidoimidazoline decarboxylase n=1 Tax=Nonomuraea sp. NPDC049419 TaxID=3155772 RepID=UPI0034158BBB
MADRLASFNSRPRAEAVADLLTCCASPAFAGEVAGRRPYGDLDELLDTASTAVRDLGWDEVVRALSAHPRIGERPKGQGREASWSRQEQSGVPDAMRAALEDGNRAYERRFGHVYLVCATGLTGAQLLARLEERLANDEEREREVVRAELAAIARLRLAKLMKEGA